MKQNNPLPKNQQANKKMPQNHKQKKPNPKQPHKNKNPKPNHKTNKTQKKNPKANNEKTQMHQKNPTTPFLCPLNDQTPQSTKQKFQIIQIILDLMSYPLKSLSCRCF